MGTWGSDIYDEDSALDYINGIIRNLSNAVRDIVKRDYTLLHPGMPQSSIFMCYIDLLIAICSRGKLYHTLPGTDEIKKWKAKYMEVWEFCIDECLPTDEYKVERAKVLKNSFNKLIALAKRRDRENEKQANYKKNNFTE